MDPAIQLALHMAAECKRLIQAWDGSNPELPHELQPAPLRRMCEQVERNAGSCSATTLHRWIGFIQCGMVAQGMLDAKTLRAMLTDAKIQRRAAIEGRTDLRDHLDPENSFELELGGEG